MQSSRASTRRAALAAFLLFAAVLLLVVAPAEASRTTIDARPSLAAMSTHELASREPWSLERPALGLASPTLEPSGFSLGEDLSVFDTTNAQGSLGLCGLETRRCALTYARNNPLKYVDPDGREFAYAGDALFKARIMGSLNRLRTGHPRIKSLVKNLDESVFLHTFRFYDSKGAGTVWWRRMGVKGNDGENGTGTDSTVYINTDLSDSLLDKLVAHELSHAEDADTGTYNTEPDCAECDNVTESKATRMGNLTPSGRRNPDTKHMGQPVKDPTAVPPEPPGKRKKKPDAGNSVTLPLLL